VLRERLMTGKSPRGVAVRGGRGEPHFCRRLVRSCDVSLLRGFG
jgi:hypothetical protein